MHSAFKESNGIAIGGYPKAYRKFSTMISDRDNGLRWSQSEAKFFKDEISKIPLVKVDEDCLTSLTNSEREKFSIFSDVLLDEDLCQLIFRGESCDHAYRKSNAFGHTEEKKLVNHCRSVFYIGVKSKAYLYELRENDRLRVHDISELVFRKLHRLLHHASDETIHKHRMINKLSSTDEDRFIEKILQMSDQEKFETKKYYTWILHVTGESQYNRMSYFLSTSKNYSVASNNFAEEGLLYCAWIPRPVRFYATYLRNLLQIEHRLEEVGLPTYRTEPYPEENEVSLLNGMFPHYTVGIYSFSEHKLVVNTPLLLELGGDGFGLRDAIRIIHDGIKIDQSDFEVSVELQNSSYKSWVCSDASGFSEDFDI